MYIKLIKEETTIARFEHTNVLNNEETDTDVQRTSALTICGSLWQRYA